MQSVRQRRMARKGPMISPPVLGRDSGLITLILGGNGGLTFSPSLPPRQAEPRQPYVKRVSEQNHQGILETSTEYVC
jgi:hypothetical protein